MKNLIFTVLLFIFLLFGVSKDCFAEERQTQNIQFHEWYEENKNIDGATFTLTEMIFLSGKPFLFDGTGNVVIDCGKYGFIIDTVVEFSNPNLTLRGYGDFVLMARSSDAMIVLKQGKIEAENGMGIVVTSGSISGNAFENNFYIQAKGLNSTALYLSTTSNCSFTGLNIDVEGTGDVKGIYSYYANDIDVFNCKIRVTGTGSVSGVNAKGNLTVKNSTITAQSSAGESYANSVSGKTLIVESSSLTPAISEIPVTTYIVYAYESLEPIFCSFSELQQVSLPDTVLARVRNKYTNEMKECQLPIKWKDKSSIENTQAQSQYITLEGSFDTENCEYAYEVESGVSPRITIFNAKDSKIFLISYQITDQSDSKTSIKLLLAYPYKSSSLQLEYGSSPTQMSSYSFGEESNLLALQSMPTSDWLYGIHVSLPIVSNQIFMKVTATDGIFSGDSEVWTIDTGSNQVIPPGLDDSKDGDRGGQAITPGTDSIPHIIPDNTADNEDILNSENASDANSNVDTENNSVSNGSSTAGKSQAVIISPESPSTSSILDSSFSIGSNADAENVPKLLDDTTSADWIERNKGNIKKNSKENSERKTNAIVFGSLSIIFCICLFILIILNHKSQMNKKNCREPKEAYR